MMPVMTLASDLEELIPIIAIMGGITVVLSGMICGVVKRSIETKAREESRREIAAYVAEGSITPDDAFKLLTANPPKKVDRHS